MEKEEGEVISVVFKFVWIILLQLKKLKYKPCSKMFAGFHPYVHSVQLRDQDRLTHLQ